MTEYSICVTLGMVKNNPMHQKSLQNKYSSTKKRGKANGIFLLWPKIKYFIVVVVTLALIFLGTFPNQKCCFECIFIVHSTCFRNALVYVIPENWQSIKTVMVARFLAYSKVLFRVENTHFC